MSGAAALAGIRVLDLSTPMAEATGRVLADLGAEVIKVEPPGGCAARFTPPFEQGREDDPEGSLFWRAYGLGKRSVVLDPERPADLERLLDLARGADIFVESSLPGEMAARGLGFDALHALNPSLLYVSVSPFGQTGPEATSPATELTIAAAGGLVNLQGDGDRPPVPVGYPEAFHHGAVQAAADAIAALYARHRGSPGQHLDVSCQAAVMWTLLFAGGYPVLMGENQPGSAEERVAPRELFPGVVVPDRAACKDGFVVMTLVLGEVGSKSFGSMMQWAIECGAVDEDLTQHDWTGMFGLLGEGKIVPGDIQRAFDCFIAFLGTRTKAEIQQRALAGKWLIGPAWTTAELLADPQLAARGYWVDVDGTTQPGPFARLSRTPIRYERGAPRLGQDQHLVEEAPTPSAPARVSPQPRGSIFEGLKVADFSWVAALPLMTKDLANLGATVIKVESEKSVDPLRMIPPWKDGVPNVNGGYCAANYNQSKLGLGLDLASEAGREVALRLVDWADVVTESFTAGSAARLGLDYETLRKRKPELVMISSCMRGQTGPEAGYTGFGLQGAGLAGFVALTGWPDRIPSGPWGAYTDFIAPRYSLAALAAALHHRDRTGEGQYIDISQSEATIHFLSPAVLEYTVNGRVLDRAGHDSERACPHGIYATLGVERYVAIAVETAAQWQALCGLVPGLRSLATPELDLLGARLRSRPELEAALSEWCAGQEPFEAANALRAAGVPAYVVMRATDLHEDPQLLARDFFVDLDHPYLGRVRLDGPVTRFSGTPAAPTHAGPTMGQHTFEILTEVLGYDADEAANLAAAGALT
jgi:crotonobetainyl-CoA:carnitine CoA-transferase CaiB-like acyl-CoA transferase